MGVGQLSESDAVDALRLPFYSSSHPTGSHGWRNQFDLGNPDLKDAVFARGCPPPTAGLFPLRSNMGDGVRNSHQIKVPSSAENSTVAPIMGVEADPIR